MRRMMLNLHDLEMITSQYAYITFEITPDSCKGDDGRDEDACKAFEGIMDISNYIPSTQDYKDFEEKVRQKMPQFAGLGYHMRPDEEVQGFSVQFRFVYGIVGDRVKKGLVARVFFFSKFKVVVIDI